MEEEDIDVLEENKDELEVVYLDELEEIEDVELDDELNDQEDASTSDFINQQAIDLSKLSFNRHTKSVFTGALSKSGLLAATGGEDDIAYVWSVENGDVVLECTGHKDSVTEVAFNFNDQYIATGDMCGLIQVWSLNEKKLIWCYEGDDMEWLMWHHLANVLISGCESGDIYVWQIPEGHCKVLASQGTSTTCAKVLSDGKRLLAGYGDGQVRLWNLKSGSVLWQLATNIPTDGVTSLDVTDDSSLLVVAPSAQLFKVVDGHQVASYLLTNENEVEVIAFNNELGLLATGALSGKFCVWDYKKNSLRHEAKLETPITTIKWGPRDMLIVGGTDGCIYVCDAKSGTLVEILTGHNADILSLTLSKDGTCILSTSDDATAKLFAIKVN